jgi:hypothetical protein
MRSPLTIAIAVLKNRPEIHMDSQASTQVFFSAVAVHENEQFIMFIPMVKHS